MSQAAKKWDVSAERLRTHLVTEVAKAKQASGAKVLYLDAEQQVAVTDYLNDKTTLTPPPLGDEVLIDGVRLVPLSKGQESWSGQKGTPEKNPHDWPDWDGRRCWAWPFLDALAVWPNVTQAAKAARITRQKVYECREKSEVFARCWEQALDESVEMLEAEVHRRAFEGYDEPVFYKGTRISTVRKYSDVLAIFLLKAHRPERYRDRYDVKAGGSLVLDMVFPDRPGRETAKETARQVGEMLSKFDDGNKS